MTKAEIATFIEEMEVIGDKWTEKQVEETYGKQSLADALADRKGAIDTFGKIVSTVLNQ